ncbi:MAG TPA: protease inhibitor I9 family protein, partial [Methanothrix sp.]|nr:protease inhibitor I9 family protein [Methanothrix sp.]
MGVLVGVVALMDGDGWRPILAVGLLLSLMVAAASPAWAEPGEPKELDEPMSAALDLLLGEEFASEEKMPVIVIFKDGANREVEGLEVEHSYRLVNGVSGYADPSVLRDLASDPRVAGVYPDGSVSVAQPEFETEMNETISATSRVNATPLWERG